MSEGPRNEPRAEDGRIGIVVPAYRAQRFLPATLKSIAEQTLREWTCVIVDDGSDDDTALIAQSFVDRDSRFSLFRQANRGLCGARHAGLACLLACETVIFVDSDDVLEPDALAILDSALTDRPDAVGASALADYIDGEGRQVHPGEHPDIQRDRQEPLTEGQLRNLDLEEDTTFASLTVDGRIWPTAVALLRIKAVVSAGLFDEAMVPQEDWEFYLRLSRLGSLVFVNRRVAWYRRHDANATNDAALAAMKARQRLRRKTWSSRQTTPGQRDAIVRAAQCKKDWEVLRDLRQVKAALLARRPLAASAAAVCVVIGRVERPRERPRVSPHLADVIYDRCGRIVRNSDIGSDADRKRMIT